MSLILHPIQNLLYEIPILSSYYTDIDYLFLVRHDNCIEKISFHPPAIVWIEDGSIDIEVGATCYSVHSKNLYVGVLPHNGKITFNLGTSGKFLAIGCILDYKQLVQYLNVTPDTDTEARQPGLFALQVSPTPILECFNRLLNLLNQPEDIPVLADLAYREIHYRIMKSEAGNSIAKLLFASSYAQRTSQATLWLTHHYRDSLSVPQLAKQFGMSESVFYCHFKEQIGVSPIQYQKQLRLKQAQYLIRSLHYTVSRAAIDVGYASLTQFSREYRRQFGHPPSQETSQISGL